MSENGTPGNADADSGSLREDGRTIGDASGIGGADGIATVDPATGATSGGTPRRRGRPPGSKNKPAEGSASERKATSNAVDTTGLETILFSMHQFAAGFVAPELEIDKSEASTLAKAIAAVNEHYGQKINPKMVAVMALFGAAGSIYGPRVGAIVIRKQMEKSRPRPTVQSEAPQKPVTAPQPPRGSGLPPGHFIADPSFVSLPGDYE